MPALLHRLQFILLLFFFYISATSVVYFKLMYFCHSISAKKCRSVHLYIHNSQSRSQEPVHCQLMVIEFLKWEQWRRKESYFINPCWKKITWGHKTWTCSSNDVIYSSVCDVKEDYWNVKGVFKSLTFLLDASDFLDMFFSFLCKWFKTCNIQKMHTENEENV